MPKRKAGKVTFWSRLFLSLLLLGAVLVQTPLANCQNPHIQNLLGPGNQGGGKPFNAGPRLLNSPPGLQHAPGLQNAPKLLPSTPANLLQHGTPNRENLPNISIPQQSIVNPMAPTGNSARTNISAPRSNFDSREGSASGVRSLATTTIGPHPIVWTTPNPQFVPGIKVVDTAQTSGGATSAQGGSRQNVYTRTAPGTNVQSTLTGYTLKNGSMFISAKSKSAPVAVKTPTGQVLVGKGSDVLVTVEDGTTRVHNLSGLGDSVKVEFDNPSLSNKVVSVKPGFELVTSQQQLSSSEIRPGDGVARRNPVLVGDGSLAVSEFSIPSVLKNNQVMADIRKGTKSDQKRIENLLKMAAALESVRGPRDFEPPGMARLQQVADRARQRAQDLLGNGPPPPPVIPPGGGGGGPGGGTGGAGGRAGGFADGTSAAQQNAGGAANTLASLPLLQSTRGAIVPTDQIRNGPHLRQRGQARSAEERRPRPERPVPSNPQPALNTTQEQPTATQTRQPEKQLLASAQPDESKTASTRGTDYETNGNGNGAVTDNSLHGTVKGAGKAVRQVIQRYPEAVLAVFLLIGFLFAIAVYYANAAYARARELNAVNKELKAQVDERLAAERELATLNAELSEARDHALEAARLKGEFVANISHEIRTPVTAVLGLNNMLLETKLGKKQREYAMLIRHSANSLLAVINDLLDFSKIEAGKIALEVVDFPVRRVVADVTDMLLPTAQVKGLKLESEISKDVPVMIQGDPGRLRQVLLNLVGNAVKFTQQGTIRINVQKAEDNEDRVELAFSVLDTGIGISPDLREKLFSPFVQADGSATRQFGGTGLGLSISKRLVELMGGNIGVESNPGVGSRFWFTALFGKSNATHVDESTAAPESRKRARKKAPPAVLAPEILPVVPEPPIEPTIEEDAPAPAAVAGQAKILVAEDSVVLQRVVKHQLEKLGYQVELVANGKDAVARYNSGTYDLILMDWQMPDMDGLGATRVIRDMEGDQGHHVPIIAMTANAMEGDKDRCLEAGMNDYISKPFSPEQLRETIEQWLKAS